MRNSNEEKEEEEVEEEEEQEKVRKKREEIGTGEGGQEEGPEAGDKTMHVACANICISSDSFYQMFYSGTRLILTGCKSIRNKCVAI